MYINPILLTTENNIAKWQVTTSPFHPACPFLSETHKDDYPRVYLMHHFGGGYPDLKVDSRPSMVSVFRRSDQTAARLARHKGSKIKSE